MYVPLKGLYKYGMMFFKLEITLELSHRVTDVVLDPVKWQFCLISMDYKTIFEKTSKEHLIHVGEELMILNNAGKTMKLKKCSLCMKTIDNIGYVIQSMMLYLATKSTEVFESLQYPTTISKLRLFSGFVALIDVSF